LKYRHPYEELGLGPNAGAGSRKHVLATGTWRAFKPVVDTEKCTRCGLCETYCPDGTIKKTDEGTVVDYAYCKGCGICANECRVRAIEMVRETD